MNLFTYLLYSYSAKDLTYCFSGYHFGRVKENVDPLATTLSTFTTPL
jgi:hypothetical protein